jgi:hypothetical protein
VYLAAVVVVVTAMVNGITEKGAAAMRELVGVSERTLRRWRQWWRESFIKTEFWRTTRARFVPPIAEQRLPTSILERFGKAGESDGLLAVLGMLSPLTGGATTPMD